MSSPSIHILGLGNLGKLIAHSLKKCHPELPITLLFHRKSLVEEWNQGGRCIEIVRNGQSDRQGGFLWELIQEQKGAEIQQQAGIQNLIVATKTYATSDALRPLVQRLGPSSTLLFLQNGMGMYPDIWLCLSKPFVLSVAGTIDHVTSDVFEDPPLRPHYLAGIVSHGVYATSHLLTD